MVPDGGMSGSGTTAMMMSALLAGLISMLIWGCTADRPVADCDLSRGVCVKELSHYKVVFYTEPAPPEALKETVFNLEITPPVEAERIVMELTMPGMYMGENTVELRKTGGGKYKGKGIIVKCPSGSTLWQADFLIPEAGRVGYRFHVIY